MIEKLAATVSRIPWPHGDAKLLLEAALLPDAQASQSWKAWQARRDIESVVWEEQRLLARIAPRLAAIDPACSFRRRLEGVAKAHWVQSQSRMRLCIEAIDILKADNVETMLLKGAALNALGWSNGLRLSGDVDVMVRRRDFDKAIRLLGARGWVPAIPAELRKWRSKPGVNLIGGNQGDIDVHHQPMHDGYMQDGALETIWSRAGTADFHGRRVAVPSPMDMIIFASNHATHNSARGKPATAWVFDIDLILKHAPLNGRQLFETAASLGAGMDVYACLSYIRSISDGESRKLITNLLADAQFGIGDCLHFLYRSARSLKLLRKARRWVSSREQGTDVLRPAT